MRGETRPIKKSCETSLHEVECRAEQFDFCCNKVKPFILGYIIVSTLNGPYYITFTFRFTFSHLADAFVQSEGEKCKGAREKNARS